MSASNPDFVYLIHDNNGIACDYFYCDLEDAEDFLVEADLDNLTEIDNLLEIVKYVRVL